jgi:RimJ/RimL family protein N-acetyltransferase
VSERVELRSLRRRDREASRAFLLARPRENLVLLDLLEQHGRSPQPGEARAELLVARRGTSVVGVASLRPTLCLTAGGGEALVDGLLPYCETLATGMVKSEEAGVDLLWSRLRSAGRRALVDRLETAHFLEAPTVPKSRLPDGARLRPAGRTDLEPLVVAARASLREEERPDPYGGDPEGFRRWVAGRVRNALVAEIDGRVVFVAYADIRRSEGWLIQGVYTWPEFRRCGLAAAGVSSLCGRAFSKGAAHVQLAVVDGNRAGEGLYDGLGFRPFGKLRTILFS